MESTRAKSTFDPSVSDEILAQLGLATMVGDVVVVADMLERDTPLVWVSDQFQAVTGYDRKEALGKNCRYLQGADRMQPELSAIREAIDQGKSITATLRNYRKDGTLFWNELSLTPHSTQEGAATYFIGRIKDVTDTKNQFDASLHDAKHDRLTDLPNRDSFLEYIEHIEIERGQRLLIIKIDIASLHQINKTYGYMVGDDLLKKVANRLQTLQPSGLGRIGNNEFAMAFVVTPEQVDSTLDRVSSVLGPSFPVSEAIISMKYALGYSVGDAEQSPTLLTQQAGYALHESKSDPRRDYRRYEENTEIASRKNARLYSELKQAVRDHDFIHYYQPQYDLRSGEIVSIEALIRWSHPVFGLQSPDSFITLAEQSGLIIEIERESLRQVLSFVKEINQGRKRPLGASINASPLHFARPRRFEENLRDAIRAAQVDPSLITVEITESLLTEKNEDVLATFHRVRSSGVGLSIDDFGTGYSNLLSIDQFPISEIKIDQAFTRDVNIRGTRRIMVEAILSLGREIDARVVAEGVETDEELNCLREMGCAFGQGYLLGHPMDAGRLREAIGE